MLQNLSIEQKPSLDERFMRAAINLSAKNLGQTKENPSVGAIITQQRKGKEVIIGAGATAVSGRPHAEHNALANVFLNGYKAADIVNSTLYVTLEPCSHYGKTPPCANAIIKSGIKKVIIALKDIDKRVDGKGIAMLKEAGLYTKIGLLNKEAYIVLAPYFINKLYARSFVTLKLAIGQGNVIGSKTIANFPISNNLAKAISHDLRYNHDAILVGVNTINIDNPNLTCRILGNNSKNPIRIILDSNLSININSKVVKTANKQDTIIISTKSCNLGKKQQLETKGVKVFIVKDIYDIEMILQLLYKYEIYSILVEGGANIASTFINSGYVDKYAIFKSNVVVEDDPIYAPVLSITTDYYQFEEMSFADNKFRQWLRIEKCLLV